MKLIFSCLSACLLLSCAGVKNAASGKWIPLFDGKSLYNWRVGANAETFSVDSGMLMIHGNTAHLFYEGPVQDHNFKNFELKVELMTYPGANSGIYFHTIYQESSWPMKGYEVQVNNSHTDWRRTGSLYGISDVKETYVKDFEWYTETIKVEGKRVVIMINDKVVVDYTEPEGLVRTGGDAQRMISSGTFAIQGHDPKSVVHIRSVKVRVLP